MVDPPTFLGFPTDTVNAFAGSITALAALAAAIFAARGINAWRDEMKGRRKADLGHWCRDALMVVYRSIAPSLIV